MGVRVKRERHARRHRAPRPWCSPPAASRPTPRWRTRYLGPGWELAKVRGTRFNTGDGIRMALDIGAAPYGNWSGCHAVAWDRNAPEFGDLAVGDGFQKHSYPWGVMINADGKRFVDEGADFRNYTYAKYGRVVLQQPGSSPGRSSTAKVAPHAARRVPHQAGDQGRGQHAGGAGRRSWKASMPAGVPDETIATYNAAVQHRRAVQSERQGRPRHRGAGDPQVELGQHDRHAALRGLCGRPAASPSPSAACGSTPRRRCSTPTCSRSPASMPPASWSGGIFYFNYPGGTGLINGAVFGKLAGATATADLKANTGGMAAPSPA